MYGVRALAAFLMVAGFLAAGARTAVAQDDESGLDGNTFTGPNFGWSVEWDEDVWTFETEDNVRRQRLLPDDDGRRSVRHRHVLRRRRATTAILTTASPRTRTPSPGWMATVMSPSPTNSTSRRRRTTARQTIYTYVAEIDSGDLDLIDYVSCQTVVEDEAVLIFSVTTTPNVFEDLIPIIDDVTAAITLPDDGQHQPGRRRCHARRRRGRGRDSGRRRRRNPGGGRGGDARRPRTKKRRKQTKKKLPRATKRTPNPPAMSCSETTKRDSGRG